MQSSRPRVLVAGDEPLLARGIALLLDGTRDMEAIYVESLVRAQRFLTSGRAELVVWAGDYLDEEVLVALRDLREEHPSTGLCLLARRAEAEALERLVAQSGERLAFVLYTGQVDAAELIELARSVLRGRSTIDAELLARLTASGPGAEDLQLTETEREIMDLVALGLRNREIGRRLWKSEKAVEKHVGRLFSKLGLPAGSTGHLDRRVAATRIYLSLRSGRSHGLIDRGDTFEVPGPAPAPAPEPCGSA